MCINKRRGDEKKNFITVDRIDYMRDRQSRLQISMHIGARVASASSHHPTIVNIHINANHCRVKSLILNLFFKRFYFLRMLILNKRQRLFGSTICVNLRESIYDYV